MITKESALRDAARLMVWYPLRWGVSVMPLPIALAEFRLFGRLHQRLRRAKRESIARNLKSALASRLTGADLAIEVRRYFENHYVNQLLIFLFPRLNRSTINRFHSFIHLDKLDRVLAGGRGCVLIHPHFGPVHLPLFHLGLLGYRVNQVGYLRKPPGLSRIGEAVSFRLRERYERMIPARIIPGDRFLRPAFEHLKSNGVLMMTGDGSGGGEFLGMFQPVSFLGRTMLFPTGPARLAEKTGAAVLALFTIPGRGNGRYLSVIEEIAVPPGAPGRAEAVQERFVKLCESYLTRHPGLWHFWDEFETGKLLI